MKVDNCVAFQWSVDYDNTRRVGALTTYGKYQPDNTNHVKMNLDDLPPNFLSEYETNKFIYHPPKGKNPEYVEEDLNYEEFLENKYKKSEEEQEPIQEPYDAEKEQLKQEVADLKKQMEEFADLKKQMEEMLKLLKGGNQ